MIPNERKQYCIDLLNSISSGLSENYTNSYNVLNPQELALLDNYIMHKLTSTGLIDEFMKFAMRGIQQGLENNPEEAIKGLRAIKRERIINNTMHTAHTRIEELLNTYIEDLPQKTPTQKALSIGSLSYNWLNNPDTELSKLYQLLKDNKLIHPNTTLEQFKAVFTAKPLQSIQPIDWIGAKNLLAYFLQCIYKTKVPTNTNIWSVAKKCFVNANSLAQSKTNYENSRTGKPKGFEVIDEIIKAL